MVTLSHVRLPLAAPDARLVAGDATAPLYFGSTHECWQLQRDAWQECPSAEQLTQARQTFTDRGNHTWNVSPMGASVDPGPQPGIIEAIPGSRVIQLYVDTDAATHLRQYGQLVLGVDDTGPHVLRVDPGRDFATTVDVVRAWLRSQRY